MLMLNTRPAAKGSRNIKARLEPRSRSFCSEPEEKACEHLDIMQILLAKILF